MRISRVDKDMIQQLITRNNFRALDFTHEIYGGNCPFCGRERSFIMWSIKGTFRCFWCGCDGSFAATPERVVEARRLLRESQESN